jgi:hypothetical protein
MFSRISQPGISRLFGLLGWTRLGLGMGLALDWLKSMWLQLGPSSSSPAASAQPNGA